MDEIAFLVTECTFLRYFVPLVIETNKRGVRSRFFIAPNNKYTNPHAETAQKQLKILASQFGIRLHEMDELNDFSGVVFAVEASGIGYASNQHHVYSLTYMTDFSISYERYANDDRIKGIIMPSYYLAKYYEKLSDKNLYLGSPKYDVDIDVDRVCADFCLSSGPKALVMFPRLRDLRNIKMEAVYDTLRKQGFQVLVKTRAKDPVSSQLQGDCYFTDREWFPHTTMSLMAASDVVINFDSTTVKECVMLDKPLINFRIKPFQQPLSFLYQYAYCVNLSPAELDFSDTLKDLLQRDLESEFRFARKQHLFEKGAASRIIDMIVNNHGQM